MRLGIVHRKEYLPPTMEETPPSKRWIWITASVVTALGGFCWLYLQDDPPEPDDDLIRQRAEFSEEENGYELVMALDDDLEFEPEDGRWVRDFWKGVEPWDEARVARLLEEWAPALEVLDALANKRVIAAPPAMYPPNFWNSGEHFGKVRLLGEVTMLAMVRSAMEEDAAAFTAHLTAGRRLAEQIEVPRQSLLDILVGMKVRENLLRGVAGLAASPLFADAECRQQGLAVLDGWEGEDLWRDAMKDEYHAFRKTVVDLKSRDVSEGMEEMLPYETGWAFGAMRLKVNRTAHLAADHVREALTVKGETWKEWKARLPVERKPHPVRASVSPNGTGEVLFCLSFPPPTLAARTVFRLRTRLEMTRTLFALRDFQEASGHLPGELGELVPQFLESMPMDLMDGNPLHYDPSRGVLWSVGGNLTDDGGDLSSNKDASMPIPWALPATPEAADAEPNQPRRRRVILAP